VWVVPAVPWKQARAEDHDCDQRTSHHHQREDNRPTADCQDAEQDQDQEEKDRRVLVLHDSPSSAGIEQLDRRRCWTTRLETNDSSLWVEGPHIL
jgi:hypothetical protein